LAVWRHGKLIREVDEEEAKLACDCCKEEEVEERVGVVWRTHALLEGIYGGRCSITERQLMVGDSH
jgi:hypothetical protein